MERGDRRRSRTEGRINRGVGMAANPHGAHQLERLFACTGTSTAPAFMHPPAFAAGLSLCTILSDQWSEKCETPPADRRDYPQQIICHRRGVGPYRIDGF